MIEFEKTLDLRIERGEQFWWQIRSWVGPVLTGSVAVTVLLMLLVATSKPVWSLLGAGRGFIPEEYYHLWGFVLAFGTVFGQAVGWAGGSAIAFYAMTLVGFPSTWTTVRLAMGIVYLGLAVLPLSVYHVLYGGWLLGIPRLGLREWLAANHPGAVWLLISAHPVVDLSVIPLALLFLGILWKFGERARRDTLLQTLLALALLGTSLAVALSLVIHSTLVHIRIAP